MTNSDSTSEENNDIVEIKKMVDINTYTEKQYSSYLNVLKFFTIYCIILLILAILRKRNYLSNFIINILSLILVIIGGIHLFILIQDINARSNMNFDEYDWTFDPSKQSDPSKLDPNADQSSGDVGGVCRGDSCCDSIATSWCESSNACIGINETCESDCTDTTIYPTLKCDNGMYWCPNKNLCVDNVETNNCCDTIWCPYEGTCTSDTKLTCKTQLCALDTQEQQATTAGSTSTDSDVALASGGDSCNTTFGLDHEKCQHDSGHHDSFVSGIADSFKKFTNSMVNKKKEPFLVKKNQPKPFDNFHINNLFV
tara:strand:+ start:73 stop:1008 length:936 start_codon:yes stop_codon:yes gene_type:complete